MQHDWWTERDEAEVNLLIWEFVNIAWAHKEHCQKCIARKEEYGSAWCPAIAAALDCVLDYRQGRIFYAKVRRYLEAS